MGPDKQNLGIRFTPDRRQSKTLKNQGIQIIIARNSVFDCHLSQVGRQMAIENLVSNDFLSTFVDSIDVFDCPLSGVKLKTIFLTISWFL